MELLSIIQSHKDLLEKKLEELDIPSAPAELYEPIRYILSLGGKRMRPVMLMMAAEIDRKSTRLNSSHSQQSRMPSSA